MTTNDVPSKWCQGGETTHPEEPGGKTTHPEEPGGETTHPEEPGGSDESVLRIFFTFAKKFSDIESDICVRQNTKLSAKYQGHHRYCDMKGAVSRDFQSPAYVLVVLKAKQFGKV